MNTSRTQVSRSKAQQRQRVIDAVNEILSNPGTPKELYGHVAEFVVESVNNRGSRDSLIYDKPVLAVIIDTYSEDELIGASPEK